MSIAPGKQVCRRGFRAVLRDGQGEVEGRRGFFGLLQFGLPSFLPLGVSGFGDALLGRFHPLRFLGLPATELLRGREGLLDPAGAPTAAASLVLAVGIMLRKKPSIE